MRLTYLLALATSVSMPALAAAQDMSVPPGSAATNTDDEEELGGALGSDAVIGNEIIVTGRSVLPGAVDTPYEPIQTFEESDIAAYGASSIAELLDAISPQTGSGRGRGGGRPVMLVNGLRITSWREMRNIPPEAIRQMQVLPEEVALQFGYSADQRVVNLILKDNFAAGTGAGEYNRPTRGGYDNYELETGIFSVSGPRRYNLSAKLTETSMLTEDERGIAREPGEMPTVAGDPDPRRFRSLAGDESELEINGTVTQGLGEGGMNGQITGNLAYTRTVTNSLSGLDTFTLSDGAGNSEIRTYDDPLAQRVSTDLFEGGLGYNRQIDGWQLSITGDGAYTDTATQVDRRRDTSGIEADALAGELDIAGALPQLPGPGVDFARNRTLALTSLATLSGRPVSLPAGDASLTLKAGYNYSRTLSDDTRSEFDTVRLTRGDVSAGVNLALPLTSRNNYFLDAIGDLSLNLGAGINHLSDFGTLTNWTAGLSWSPTETLTLQATYLGEEAAPTLSQLGAPQIVNYNVSVYDFTNSTTALVTATSGGNPDLLKEKRRDIKLSANWQLPFLDRSNLVLEYFRNRSDNVSQSFPLLTPAIEAAFPDRVTRDENGSLIAIDQRPVTFDKVSSSNVRWGFNISGSLGATEPPSGGPSARSPNADAPRGPGGPGGPGGGRNFDPARFEAIKAALCTEGQEPDLSALPEPMLARLRKEDGSIDKERLAAMRERICNSDGPPSRTGAAAVPASPPPARRGPPGGRWNLSLYHTWRLSEDVRIGPNSPVLDQLSGESLAAGGTPRHSIEAEGGFFLNGNGARLKGEWSAPAHVNGTGAPGSSDLRFGSTFELDLRIFMDLGGKESLVQKMPFLKGSRLSFTVDNILDSRQKVTNAGGEIPIAYQRGYRDPQGRVIGIDFRKLF
ncbi:hypothetical protein [Novosphingobium decolorationis]|uniref:hypothetical protein n=1 Tax=Novosphingobium decolorationis TaxID=2698673 RepID=UPI001EF01ACF|nr:hypothetical protein [Novosphingobium decolorationis]